MLSAPRGTGFLRSRSVSLGVSAAFLIAAGIGSSCSGGDDSNAGDQTDASTGGDAPSSDTSTPSDSSAPIDADVADASLPTTLYSGGLDSCLLKNGVLKCWGADDFGNLGNGTVMTRQPTPTAVPGISPTTVAIGGHHVCAANVTTTWCWGANSLGMLGHDPALDPDAGATACEGETCTTSPVVITGFSGVKQLALSDFTSCAIASDSTVSCWGLNENGALGFFDDAGETSSGGSPITTEPKTAPGVTAATQLAIGIDEFQCILQISPGPVTCWGADYLGYLGGNPTDAAPNVGAPATVVGITNATAITAGSDHVCALLADKTVSCWGANQFDQLGHDFAGDPLCGTVACNPTPTSVAGLSNVTAISSSNNFTCALKSDATVVCWGDDQDGQLDVDPSVDDAGGGNSFQSAPAPISGLPPVAQIAVGWFHACALTKAGDVYCWGGDQDDQLGAAVNTFTPVKIEGL